MSRSRFIADEASGDSGEDSPGDQGSDSEAGSIGDFVAEEQELGGKDNFNHCLVDNKIEEEDDKLLEEEGLQCLQHLEDLEVRSQRGDEADEASSDGDMRGEGAIGFVPTQHAETFQKLNEQYVFNMQQKFAAKYKVTQKLPDNAVWYKQTELESFVSSHALFRISDEELCMTKFFASERRTQSEQSPRGKKRKKKTANKTKSKTRRSSKKLKDKKEPKSKNKKQHKSENKQQKCKTKMRKYRRKQVWARQEEAQRMAYKRMRTLIDLWDNDKKKNEESGEGECSQAHSEEAQPVVENANQTLVGMREEKKNKQSGPFSYHLFCVFF
eukprot:g69857.t1